MSGTPYTPAQLGVRPAPELVQRLLIGAFGWMFAGLLLSAGVAYLVGSSRQLLLTVTDYWLLIIIVQLVLGTYMVWDAHRMRLCATYFDEQSRERT